MVRAVEPDATDAWIAKVRAELAQADQLAAISHAGTWSGSLFPAVALVKGVGGPAEAAGGAVLSGPDGEAAHKALEALGLDGATWLTLSRPSADTDPVLAATRLHHQLLAVDPDIVVALDDVAAQDLAAAFGIRSLPFGVATAKAGMTLLAVDGLEASLDDEDRKRAVWSQFRGLVRAPLRQESGKGARRRPSDSALF